MEISGSVSSEQRFSEATHRFLQLFH